MRYADFLPRYSAILIDGPIIVVLALLFDFVVSKIGFNPGLSLFPYLLFRFFILLQIPGFLYIVLFLAFHGGQTPGMQLMNIRVVTTQYRPIGLGRAIVRYYSQLATSIFGIFVYLRMMHDSKRQALYDKMAGTYVVQTGEVRTAWLYIAGSYALHALMFVILFSLMNTTRISLYSVDDYTRSPIWAWPMANRQFAIKPAAKQYWDAGQTYLLQAGRMDPNERNYEEKVRLLAQSAREEFKHARDIDPTNPRIHAALGHAFSLLTSQVSKENAYESYQKALELDPENPNYYYSVGVTAYKLGRYDEADSYLQETLKRDPEYTEAHRTLGLVYLSWEQFATAKSHFEKAIALYMKDNKDGRYDKQIKEIRTYVNDMPPIDR